MDIGKFRDSVQKNLEQVRQRIGDAAMRSGRSAEDVRLIAVTKYLSVEQTAVLAGLGCTNLGESRPQVLWEKADALCDQKIEWHMIGHLQRNKVKRTVAVSSLLHSVDSQRLLDALEQLAVEQNRKISLLLEVNVSNEESKSGFAEDEVAAVLDSLLDKESLDVCGLMCMGGLASDLDQVRRQFARLRVLRDQLSSQTGMPLKELSMGMSGDFEIAIEEGATMVRVGSVLYPKAH